MQLDPGVYLLLSVHCPKCQRLKSNQAAWKQLMELRRQYPVYVVWLEAATGLVAKLVRAAYRAVRPSLDPELGVPVARVGTPLALIVPDGGGDPVLIMPEAVDGWETAFAREVVDTARLYLRPRQAPRRRRGGEAD